MVQFTDAAGLAAHLGTLGVRKVLEPTVVGTIPVPALGEIARDNKNRYYYTVSGYRIYLAADANPTALQGQILMLEGTKESLKTAENPEGKWKLILVK